MAATGNSRASGYLPLPIRSDWVKLRQEPEGVRAAGAKPATLGAEFTAADVKRMLPPKARLLVRLPPTASLLRAIPLGDADHSAVEIAAAPAGAQ